MKSLMPITFALNSYMQKFCTSTIIEIPVKEKYLYVEPVIKKFTNCYALNKHFMNFM